MMTIEDIIKGSPNILYNLLQELRKLQVQRDWRQHKQVWHKTLLRWREEILDHNVFTTLKEFEGTLLHHKTNYRLHIHHIHHKQLPLITPAELAIMAASHPLLATWRASLPNRRPMYSKPR